MSDKEPKTSAAARQNDFDPWVFDEQLGKWRHLRTGRLRNATPREDGE